MLLVPSLKNLTEMIRPGGFTFESPGELLQVLGSPQPPPDPFNQDHQGQGLGQRESYLKDWEPPMHNYGACRSFCPGPEVLPPPRVPRANHRVRAGRRLSLTGGCLCMRNPRAAWGPSLREVSNSSCSSSLSCRWNRWQLLVESLPWNGANFSGECETFRRCFEVLTLNPLIIRREEMWRGSRRRFYL